MSTPTTSWETARALASAGYPVFPVKKNKAPVTPGGFKDATTDLGQVDDWWSKHKEWGVAVPTGAVSGFWGLDVDVADGKPGVDSLNRLFDGRQMPGGVAVATPSGGIHYWMRMPEGVKVTNGAATKIKAHLGFDRGADSGLDVRGDGGYLVVPPSDHPAGRPYRWAVDPWSSDPAETPDWLEAIITAEPAPAPAPPASPAGLSISAGSPPPGDQDHIGWLKDRLSWDELLVPNGWTFARQSGSDTYWVRPGKNPRDGHSAVQHGDGPLVVFTTSVPGELVGVGVPTADGSGVSLNKFDVWAAYRFRGDRSEAAREARRLHMETLGVTAASGAAVPAVPVTALDGPEPVTAGNLPLEFWERSETFAAIREASDAVGCNPTAVLLLVLTRVAACLPHLLKLSQVPGAYGAGHHMLYGVVVGEPGDGKSEAAKLARQLFPNPYPAGVLADGVKPVSGEALSATFEDWDKNEDGKLERFPIHHVYAFLDEGSQLMATAKRDGATMVAMLCSAWVGESLSGDKADKAMSRKVPEGSYSFGLGMGLQPGRAHDLFDTDQTGLIQRFLFAPARPESDGFDPEGWRKPEVEIRPLSEWRKPMGMTFTLPDEAKAELYAMRHDPDLVAERVGINAHRSYVLHKAAATLAGLDGRSDITLDDWESAKMILAASDETRGAVESYMRAEVTAKRVARGDMERYLEQRRKEGAAEADSGRLDAAVGRVAEVLASAGDRGMSASEIRKARFQASEMPLVREALEVALDSGMVVPHPTDKRRYVVGEVPG